MQKILTEGLVDASQLIAAIGIALVVVAVIVYLVRARRRRGRS